MTLQRSLMGHLMAWVLGALALVWASFIVVGFRTGVHEAAELTDGHLASVASLMLRQRDGRFMAGDDAVRRSDAALLDMRSHDYQQSMSIVVWDADGHVVTRSGEAPLPAFSDSEGFDSMSLGDPPAEWRTFSRWDSPSHERKVMVLLSVAERDDLSEDIAEQMAMPGFWLLPVIALALGWAIWRGLRPLHELSRDVLALDVHEATPLRTHHPHREFKAMIDSINTLLQRQYAALVRERELASELAHELRTPLASLTLHTRLLGGELTPQEREQSLLRIEHDAQRAAHVLSHLLSLARASRTEMAEAAQPLDLSQLASRVVADYAQAAVDNDHELALSASSPFMISGHPVLLELALRNLIENALSHTPRGTLVEVQIDSDAHWLQVCDDGQEKREDASGASGADRGDAAATATATASLASQHHVPSPAGNSLALGLGLGHRVVEKVASIHNARFASVSPPAGFSVCYRLSFDDVGEWPVSTPVENAA